MELINGWWVAGYDTNYLKPLLQTKESASNWYFGSSNYIQAICHHFDLSTRTFIDIGAQYGFVSRPLSTLFDSIHCFEPNPTTYKCLTKNMVLDNVTCHKVALSSTVSSVLFDCKQRSGTSQIVKQHSDRTIQVRSSPLDDYGFVDVDYVKIDVEGHELETLIGSVNTLKQSKPVVTIELNGDLHNHAKTIDFLYNYGYHLVGIHGSNDYTFIHNDKVKNVEQLFMGRKISPSIYQRNYPS